MTQKFDSIPHEFEADVLTAEEYCTPHRVFLEISEEERRQQQFRTRQEIAAVLALALFGLFAMLVTWYAIVDRPSQPNNSTSTIVGGPYSGVNLNG